MKVFNNVIEMVGNTPMVKVTNMDTGPCELYLKLELQNPGGSIKDRGGWQRLSVENCYAGQNEPGKSEQSARYGC